MGMRKIKKSPSQNEFGTKTHKQKILRGTTRIPEENLRALNNAFNGATRFCLMVKLSAKPLTGELQNLFRRKAFSRWLFLSFRKINFYSPGHCVIYINNKRNNNIIKSDFQVLFRLKNINGVV